MITTPSKQMKADSRFKHWAKLIGPAQIDLSKRNGYSLGGQWIRWTDQVSVVAPNYLVVAAETGSRKNHGYDYVLVGENGVVAQEEIDKVVAQADEGRRVAAHNSTLYAYALFISGGVDYAPSQLLHLNESGEIRVSHALINAIKRT